MKWVTREFVHVDRTACPWLIKKFVDQNAEFMFVATEKIEDAVAKEGAIPYDAPNVELGHHDDKCSFDAIIEKYKLESPVLLELAKIVRAADTTKTEIASEGSGLSAIMTGISMTAKDDLEAVKNAAVVYDALLTYCNLKIIREQYKTLIGKMGRKEQREFLKKKLAE
jgi:hypothetical protein